MMLRYELVATDLSSCADLLEYVVQAIREQVSGGDVVTNVGYSILDGNGVIRLTGTDGGVLISVNGDET